MSSPVALVDCNNFYVSCERVFHPHLEKKPVVVLSNNDGCVVSRSNEVKRLAIPRGAPIFQYQDLVRDHSISIFSSNYSLYQDMSNRVMSTLQLFAPTREIYSIDEAFLGLTGFPGSLETWGHEVRHTVYQWTGIPVSIGVGPTKTLAKLANHLAKKHPDFPDVLDLTTRSDLSPFLKAVPVEKVWGIGRRYGEKLRSFGCCNSYDLSRVRLSWAKKHLTVQGVRTVLELQGEPCLDLQTSPAPRKNILCSRSFSRDVTDLAKLEEAVALYASRAAEKARAQGSRAGLIEVFIKTNPFRDAPQYARSARYLLAHPTSYTPEIIHRARQLIASIYRPGYLYKKAGIYLGRLQPEDRIQYDLFTPYREPDREDALMEVVDLANRKWGRNTVHFGATGTKPRWKMRQKRLSRRFTTQWEEIPVIAT